jgi:hypothetical protein
MAPKAKMSPASKALAKQRAAAASEEARATRAQAKAQAAQAKAEVIAISMAEAKAALEQPLPVPTVHTTKAAVASFFAGAKSGRLHGKGGDVAQTSWKAYCLNINCPHSVRAFVSGFDLGF